MRAVQALIMLLGALAVLMTAAAPASADASSAPPCHETTMHHDGVETPSPASGKTMKAMDCCVAWVTTPTLLPPEESRVTAPRPAAVAAPAALPAGEQPAPDPHPPRPALS